MPNAIPAMGTVVEYGTNGSSYTVLNGVTRFSGPSPTAEVIDVTTLNAPGGYREKIVGVFDGGDWEFDMNYIKTEYTALNTIFAAKTPIYFRATLPQAGGTFVGSGTLTSVGELDHAPDGALMYKLAMAQSGPPVVT